MKIFLAKTNLTHFVKTLKKQRNFSTLKMFKLIWSLIPTTLENYVRKKIKDISENFKFWIPMVVWVPIKFSNLPIKLPRLKEYVLILIRSLKELKNKWKTKKSRMTSIDSTNPFLGTIRKSCLTFWSFQELIKPSQPYTEAHSMQGRTCLMRKDPLLLNGSSKKWSWSFSPPEIWKK